MFLKLKCRGENLGYDCKFDINFDIIFAMSKFEKLKAKIINGQIISFDEAECVLYKLGFKVRSPGSSHFIFWKDGYEKNISLKKRSQLLPYQIKMLEEVVKDHE